MAAFGYRGAAPLILFFAALFAATASVWRLVSTARAGLLGTGAPISHLGLAMMFLGIAASGGWGRGGEVRLPIGRPIEALGMTLTYRGHVDGSEPRDRWRVAVLRPGEDEVTLEVRMYHKGQDAEGRPQTMRFPAILREAGRDVYVSPLGLDVPESGRLLQLERGAPAALGDATLTFLRFDAGAGGGHGMSVDAEIRIESGGRSETVRLPLAVVDGELRGAPVSPATLPGATLTLRKMSVEQGIVVVDAGGGATEGTPETLIVEASAKPLMGILWLGTFLIGIGCAVAGWRRYVELRVPAPAKAGASIGTIGRGARG